MMLIVLERLKPGIRGELSRWMLEIHAGVFVGTVSARVRELLWEKVTTAVTPKPGAEPTAAGAWMIHDAPNEQGYALRFAGTTNRALRDYDGLQLVMKETAPEEPGDG